MALEPLKAGFVGFLAQLVFLPLLVIGTLLLVVTIIEPSIWQPVWGIIQNTGDALGDHADRLVRELNWRMVYGLM